MFSIYLISLLVLQPQEEHGEEEPGAGEQVHRGAGRAHLRQHQRHGRSQRQTGQVCYPQRNGEADQADQGARWVCYLHVLLGSGRSTRRYCLVNTCLLGNYPKMFHPVSFHTDRSCSSRRLQEHVVTQWNGMLHHRPAEITAVLFSCHRDSDH